MSLQWDFLPNTWQKIDAQRAEFEDERWMKHCSLERGNAWLVFVGMEFKMAAMNNEL